MRPSDHSVIYAPEIVGALSVKLEPSEPSGALNLKLSITDQQPSSRPVVTAAYGTVPAETLERAVRLVLKQDVRTRKMLEAGRSVTKRIPPIEEIESQTIPQGASTEAYWSARADIGALILPLFLGQPDRSKLYPYQIEGVDWLKRPGGRILADDMGLGKTLQAIQAGRELISSGEVSRIMVIAPRSLLTNWISEISTWAPELWAVALSPRSTVRESAWAALLPRSHILVTNYEQLRDVSSVVAETFHDVIIMDEAHRVRNISAALTQSIRDLAFGRMWSLTGTPLERDTEDLATLLSTVQPTRFAASDFQSHEAASIRSAARPYLLRRQKEDVLPQLPEAVESTETIELSARQRQRYRAALIAVRDSAEPDQDYLRLLNELRMLCDIDPISGDSSKIDRIIELLEDIKASGEKAVVFSHYLRPLHELERRLSSITIESRLLEGTTSLEMRGQAVQEFKTRPDVTALLASTRVAGEGLTLTEANHVIFLNEWWNPSTNMQARDRVLRIGQQRGVTIHRLRVRNTIEELLDDILERKTSLFEAIVDGIAESPDPDLAKALITQLVANLVD